MSGIASQPMSSWPAARKAAAGVFAAICAVGLACAALYASAVLFLLLNKAHPGQAHFASILQYWDLYADDPLLRKKLIGSIAASAGGLLFVLPIALFAAARARRPGSFASSSGGCGESWWHRLQPVISLAV